MSLPVLITVRYVIPAILVLVGLAILVVGGGEAVDGWALFTGAGIGIFLFNLLWRMGMNDPEREREDAARAYFDEHGEWPPEEERAAGRQWKLPINVAMPEDEAKEDEPP